MRRLALFLMLVFASESMAQSSWLVEPGSRVRVWTDGRATVGSVERIENSKIYLTEETTRAWDLDCVDRLEISRKKVGHPVIGGLIGLVAGYGLARLVVDGSRGSGSSGVGLGGLNDLGTSLATAGAVLGGSIVVGVAIGSSIKSDRWVPGHVKLRSFRGTRTPSGALALSVQVRF